MCGFIGLYSKRTEDVKAFSRNDRVKDILGHRGPDDKGSFADEHVALRFNRLSIIDLSMAGHQPMSNETNDLWLVFNGEIYNYVEIMEELKRRNHRFKSRSDSETVIHGYEEFGADCLPKFNGMWSFVLYDKKKGSLFCSRDRFGIKPFYYFIDDEKIVFASEIKAIFAAGIAAEPQERQVFNYLGYSHHNTSHETMFKNIYQLLPAHYMIYKNGKVTIQRYWDLKNEKNAADFTMNPEEVHAKFRDLFYDSIRLRLRSDVPVGVLLSGGVDSYAIASVIGDMNRNKKLTADVKTFTAAYDDAAIDESKYALEVSRKAGLFNALVYPNANNRVADDIRKMIYFQDEPPESMKAFPHWYIMEQLKGHGIKVVLSGQGADEILSGYLRIFVGYHMVDLLSRFNLAKLCSEARLLKSKSRVLYRTMALQVCKASVPRRFAMVTRSFLRDKGIRYLNADFVRRNWKAYGYEPAMSRYSRLNEHLYRMTTRDSLPRILHAEDRNSMAFSIEQRVPFLDYRLVEFVFSLSNSQKINNGYSKNILRHSLKGIMPDMITERYSKLGFTVPQKKWLTGMNVFVNDLFHSDSFRKRPYWDPKVIEKLYQKLETGEGDMESFLFRVIACELWHRTFFLN